MEDLAIAGTKLPTIPLLPAVRLRRAGPADVAREACSASDAFHMVFIHADTGGRAISSSLSRRSVAYCEAMSRHCRWRSQRCVLVSPRHETEAWALADPRAVIDTLGYRGTPASIGLPLSAAEAEQLVDPKATLSRAVAEVRGKRRAVDLTQVLPAIAQRQAFAELRRSASFRDFEAKVRTALDDLGCL